VGFRDRGRHHDPAGGRRSVVDFDPTAPPRVPVRSSPSTRSTACRIPPGSASCRPARSSRWAATRHAEPERPGPAQQQDRNGGLAAAVTACA